MTDAAIVNSGAVRPAHIPDEVVYDFDYFFDPAFLADPHRRFLDLLEKAPPVIWNPQHGGQWMVLSHEANFKAARDWESFSSQLIPDAMLMEMMRTLPAGVHIPRMAPITMNPPEHAKYRAPLQSAFSPKTVLGLKDKIRDLTNSLIDNVKDQGGCEFVSAIAEPLPVQVFLKMMGLPLDRQAEYRALVREIVSTAADVDMMGATSRILRIAASMRDTFVQRRDNPQDDLISLLWGAKIDGKPTTMEDMENYGVLLFIAGLDTVINAMGFGVCHLAQDRALQDRLRQNPALIPETVEELLRRYTFIVLPRRVAKDVVFEGVEMKEDERVMLCLAAADLDAKRFSDPERVDPDRENKAHIAFNAGHHRCLGSHLARLELQTLYQEMLARLPPFRLDPNHSPTCHGGNIFGLDSLRLIWDV